MPFFDNLFTARLSCPAIGLALLCGASPARGVAQTSSLGEGLLVVSDFQRQAGVVVVNPVSEEVVYAYNASDLPDQGCGRSAYCYTTGLQVAHHGDEDFFDVAVTVAKPRGEGISDKYYSVIRRIQPTRPATTVWTLAQLDFTTTPGGEAYCDPASAPTEGWTPGCRLAFVEGFRIIHDDPQAQTVRLVLTDGMHGRVLGVRLDYSAQNTRGEVEWVLGEGHPGWPVSDKVHPIWPNSVDQVTEGGRAYLIVNFFTSSEGRRDPLGASRIHTYVWEGGGWALAWTFPSASEEGYLNTPHMAELLTDPQTGERFIWYSHSRGWAEDWDSDEAGYGATFGRLRVGPSLSTPPEYQVELGFFEGDRILHFTRDQDPLPDGTMLLTDAGCQNTCSYEPVLYHVDPAFLPDDRTGQTGAYSPSHAEQRLVQIPEDALLGEIRCGFGSLFEAEWLPAETLGASLRQALAGGGTACEMRAR